MHEIDTETRLCAVIGHPVGHSLSPAIHNAAFRAKSLNFVYLAFDVEDARAVLCGMRAMRSFRGLSVTIPHKLGVIPYLDEIDPLAKRVGSVNTITNENGRLIGATTDGPGTLRAFEQAGVDLAGKRVVLLGTGGAVRAVAFALVEAVGEGSVSILGRTPAHVDSLVADVKGAAACVVWGGDLGADLESCLERCDVIIQGTPVGMAPDDPESSPIPGEWLRREQVVFDMVYNPLRTRLVRDAKAAGCQVILGREMLIHQAALQFERWTGVAAPVAEMRGAFEEAAGPPGA